MLVDCALQLADDPGQKKSITSSLQGNRQLPEVMRGAAAFLELAGNLPYPAEIMANIAQQMATMPLRLRADGLFTIDAMSQAIGYPSRTN